MRNKSAALCTLIWCMYFCLIILALLVVLFSSFTYLLFLIENLGCRNSNFNLLIESLGCKSFSFSSRQQKQHRNHLGPLQF